jgi:transcriptional regulator with XRE-family HTH domain
MLSHKGGVIVGKLRELREKRKLTQEALAKQLGIDRTTVAKWESGENMPRAGMLLTLAKVLRCKVDFLLQP